MLFPYNIKKLKPAQNMFELQNFGAIYYDEYTLNTNCHKDIFSKLYLEINQPMNYKMTEIKKTKKKANKLTFPDLYTSIESFLDCLFESFIKNLDENSIVWLDEYSCNIKTTISDEDDQVHTFYFKIVPCITHHNKDNVRGIMYKKNGGIEIEYPDLSIENYNKKNKKTKKLYNDTILIFKNILLKEKDIKTLPQEIIEIMLYNVPNEMFVDTSKSTLINIVNYIRNNSIKNFKTLDEQDLALTSIYRSLSLLYVKHILKIIEKFLASN